MPLNNSTKIEFWIKLWGMGMILLGITAKFLMQAPLPTVVMVSACGIAVAFGYHISFIRRMALVLAAYFLILALAGTYYSFTLNLEIFRRIYFIVSAVYYIGFLIFLLQPATKHTFEEKPSGIYSVSNAKDVDRIRWIIRLVALSLLVEGVINYLLFEKNEVKLFIILTASVGLWFFRANIGRRFGLLVCAIMAGDVLHSFSKAASHLDYFFAISLMLFYSSIFIFLFLPKTKAIFETAKP